MRLSLLRFGYIPPDLRKKLLVGLLSLLLIAATIPVGLYLVSRPQDTRSRASSNAVSAGQTGFILETKKTEWNGLEEIPVSIIAKSDIDEANLFVAKLAFDPKKLEVLGVASSSGTPNSIEGDYFIKKWIEASFDNLSGTISIIGGIPNPGFKSTSDKKAILATVVFRAKSTGNIELSLTGRSAVYKNKDNLNILASKESLVFSVNGEISNESSASAKKTPIRSQSNAGLELVSPKSGESFNYLSSIPVRWNSKEIDQISISLFKDNLFFGRVFDFIPNPGQYDFEPRNILAVPFITAGSSYQVELKGKTKSGEILSRLSSPFLITLDGKTATASANIRTDEADISLENSGGKDGVIDFKDLSILFSSYGKSGSADLNKDGLINDLDLWLLKKVLLDVRIIQ